MNEPSVLDYVKSIFRSWSAFGNFVKALFERRDTTQFVEAEIPASQPGAAVERAPVFDFRNFAWLPLAVLGLALAAQKTFEPPQQFYYAGVVLYISALGVALLAFRRGVWNLPPLPADEMRVDSLSVRGMAFILSLVFGALAFYKMSGNLFTTANVTLWVGAIFFHLWAFWERAPRSVKSSFWNVKELLARNEWTIHVTRWGLLIILVAAVSVFFHTYRLNAVAPEMTSDHAEKLMDVYDITQGRYSIFFPRNTGREPLYIYLSAWASQWFGISFLTLKIVAVAGGLLTLPFIYLLGRELGGARVGLLATAFAGFAYWPTVLERFGLRISFYPLFSAATLYFFIRGLRRQRRNDFILAGAALGLGLNGYTPFRIVPIALMLLFIVYFLHLRDGQSRKQALIWFGLLALTAWAFFIPLARYGLEHPDVFGYRALSRVSAIERPFPAPVWQLFLSNFWNAIREFNWYNGNIWVHSVPYRPALDVVSGALFLIGITLVLARYVHKRHWMDILIVLAIPLLQMPSILSLAYPDENPSLNRTAGALVPVFLLVGFGLDVLLAGFFAETESGASPRENESGVSSAGWARSFFGVLVLLALAVASFSQNYDLIFNQYYNQYRHAAWNSSEMGSVMKSFMDKGGSADNVWIVPYAYWVDTRLPPFWAGAPGRDIAIAPDNIDGTANIPGAKLFMFNTQDVATMEALHRLYPDGALTIYQSSLKEHDFYVFRAPAH